MYTLKIFLMPAELSISYCVHLYSILSLPMSHLLINYYVSLCTYSLISTYPLITVIDCNSLPSPANGNVMQPSTTYMSVTEYSCNDGFDLVGNPTRSCQASGNWSGEQPMCETNEELNSLQQNKSMIPLIAGVVAGVIAAALIAIGIVLAIVVTVKRRKRGNAAEMMSNENTFDDFNNPVYSGMLVF